MAIGSVCCVSELYNLSTKKKIYRGDAEYAEQNF